MKVYFVEDGESHWYIAESRENALNLHLEPLGEYLPCAVEEMDVEEMSDDSEIEVMLEDDGIKLKLTAAEWVKKYNREMLLATSAY